MKNTNNIFVKYNGKEDTQISYCKNKILCIDEYGFITDKFVNSSVSEHSLKNQWYEKIEQYEDNYKKYLKSIKILRLVRLGIPLTLKNTIWKIFVHKDFLYNYKTLKSQENEYAHQIHVDIQRTFRTHYLFTKKYGRGQSELFNILTAFANFMPSIGYCQGMSNIAGIILMYFPEEEAFELLVNIVQKNKLETLFDKSLSKCNKIQLLQIELFKLITPDVLTHLDDNGVDLSIYAIGWYLTLFTRFNIKYVLRFWDLFLYLDFSIFLFIAASILKFFSNFIFKLKDEQLVEFMGKIDTFEMDIDEIIFNSVKYAKKFNYLNYKKKLN
ncbi:hypothetical protein NCER_100108 [Vairimorpha ceranae BRL01]|uniref:Rab-GAP TBC domain-containing protein n=1 Tax=Vairimorpha ceranae (strain BRL01) TaxID=578460 RepID=C4V6R5_VAIC1|nr:hypothetical protein NCER_100108 [Vairimorpha ceranae BRL01]